MSLYVSNASDDVKKQENYVCGCVTGGRDINELKVVLNEAFNVR